MKLNLDAKTQGQERVLEYLENNVSEILADKINNGVTVEKDGKTLINKKTLSDFMAFANEQARKVAEKGASSAFVDDDTVFGWAIHYFEEDEIIGKLYNGDGTEYEPPKPKTSPKALPKPAPNTKVIPPKPAEKPQLSMFDLINNESVETEEKPDSNGDTIEVIITKMNDTEETPANNNPIDEEPPSVNNITQPIKEKPQGSPVYQAYMSVQNKYPEYIVAYRLGDFYEVFGKNAVMLAEELNLTLTGRDCGLESRVPMIGFPYHAADAYFGKIASVHKFVIAESESVIRTFNPPAQDDDDNVEEIPYEEMKAFDGDINEPADIPDAPTPATDETETDDFMKCFDSEAVAKIYELLGDMLDLQ